MSSSPNPHNSNDNSSAHSSQRSQPSVWSAQQPQQRRGLTPISTTFNSAARPSSSSQSPRNPWSPTQANPATNPLPPSRQGNRSSSISSGRSPFSPPPSSQQQSQSNPLLRSIASSVDTQVASNAASTSQGGGSGGSNSGSGANTRLSRASPSISHSTFGSPTGSSTTSQAAVQSGSLSKIVVAQLFLLLSTIKEDKDKTKWESQVDQIRKLVDQHGMDVFTKYFRRLLITNASQIWHSSRTGESSGNYQILVTEVQKITEDFDQAAKIVESVDYGEGEVFKDFDLSTFMEHFKMNAFAKMTLATAFKRASRSDLRTKADAIIASNIANFFSTVANAAGNEEPSSEFLALIIDRLAQHPPRNWSKDLQQQLFVCVQQRYHNAVTPIPLEISSSMFLFEIQGSSHPLVGALQKHGPKSTEGLDACKSMLDGVELRDINPQQVASALIFTVIAKEHPPYDASTFISALREHRGGQRLDWQDVVQAFDREHLKVTKSQFKELFDALMPLAKDYENFDIQRLWGGSWQYEETQLCFNSAYLSFTEKELDASQIPKLRKAFTLEDFSDASNEVKASAETAVKHPLVSLDAVSALFNMVFRSTDTYAHAQSLGVVNTAINRQMDIFVCAVSGIPKPWGGLQDQAMKQLVHNFFVKQTPGYEMVFHILWKRDQGWLKTRFTQFYQQNPLYIPQIYEHAEEQGWLRDLINSLSELSLDLAAYAHGKNAFNLEEWLDQTAHTITLPRLLMGLNQFLKNKAEDDIQSHRDTLVQTTVPLQIKTVYTILTFLGNSSANLAEDDLVQLQRACIQAYPRLINYGEGFDAIIDENSQDGNAISIEADAKMQEHYKLMYSNDIAVREIVTTLQKYKNSDDRGEQDLYACMIFGLFDEYNCFGEYPLDALATTAVLFGSLINYDVLSRIALQAAVAMVLEAVRDYPPTESMYKFGLQALLHFQERLEDWTRLAHRLLEVEGLRGTPVFPMIEKVTQGQNDAANGDSHDPHLPDGPVDAFLEPKSNRFLCLSVDPPIRQDFYQDPDERVKDEVSFILNNATEQNVDDKTKELTSKLHSEHHQWFANYLVDKRVKPQPNFRNLYMEILDRIGEQNLWSEVLRETYANAIHLLNAEATLTSTSERNYLKNLGVWLGSITLARDQPIKYKNISFRDLLLEAYDTQRLIVAIPFTCKVLAAVAQSVIFKPPCSWTMEIVEILTELYYHSDIKLNLKFEIEVLCKDIGLDHTKVEPSDAIRNLRNRPQAEEDLLQPGLLDGPDGFGDLSLMNLPRRAAHDERFSPSAMVPAAADIAAGLKHTYHLPPTSVPHQNRIRTLLESAVERAVSEIIGPVVERSVTIAAISTANLVAKDFQLEPDATRYQESAHTAVRTLAGSLASVTCKEPLRASMQNNIRLAARAEHLNDVLSEQIIYVFINENLDNVCKIVEAAAEDASVSEIDAHIETNVANRKNGTYVEPPLNPWSKYIPEPFRHQSGGLNEQQKAIYQDFPGAARPRSTHANTLSSENARQVPDVLQEQLPPIANLTNTSDAPMLSRQMPQTHSAQQFHDMPQPPMNGYADTQSLGELVNEIHRAAQDNAAENSRRNVTQISPALSSLYQRLTNIISASTSKLDVARAAIAEVAGLLFRDEHNIAVTDVLALMLNHLVISYPIAGQDLKQKLAMLDYDHLCNAEGTVALLNADMLMIQNVDMSIARAIQNRTPGSLSYLGRLVDHILLTDPPNALRSDLSSSFSALAQWLHENPDDQDGRDVAQKLQNSSRMMSPIGDQPFIKDVQNEYVFDEWVRLQYNESQGPALVSFILQLQTQKTLSTQADLASFLRTCVNASVMSFEQEDNPNLAASDAAYKKIDGLAKLIVHIVAHQGKLNGAPKPDKAAYFEVLMTIVTLVIAQYYHQRLHVFNQKVFFRLFSSVICEVHHIGRVLDEYHNDIMLRIGKCLKMLQPQLFPAFTFAWTSILSHRLFIPALLKSSDATGWDLYCDLLKLLLAYVGEQMKPLEIPVASKDLYRGTLKLLVVLYHDFPAFLADNHYELLTNIPPHCTHMRSLVISASPDYFPELPDLFSEGVKAGRLQEISKPPVVRGDFEALLQEAGILSAVDQLIRNSNDGEASMESIIKAMQSTSKPRTGIGFVPLSVDPALFDALVLYIVNIHQSAGKEQTFSANSSYAQFLEELVSKLHPEGRYFLLSAIANQLRYPNSHTQFFSYALLHLFRPGHFDAISLDIQQQVTRVMLERLMSYRPHPWGLVMTTMEILKNRQYRFWELPFVKASTDVERMFASLLQQMSQNQRVMA